MWTCSLCDDKIMEGRVIDHFRLMHPDIDFNCDTWPDGEPVVVQDPDDENWS